MSTKIIVTCDRCKEAIEEDKQIWEVAALAECRQGRVPSAYPRNFTGSMYKVKKNHKMEVCRPCLIHLGFVTGNKEVPDPPETPSLEEILREIIAEEVQTAVEGGY